MNGRIKAGEAVTWASQAAGSVKEKTGTVLGFVPSWRSAFSYVPALRDVPKGRRKFDCPTSDKDRYVVEVPRASGNGSDFYAPLASVVEKQNTNAGRST